MTIYYLHWYSDRVNITPRLLGVILDRSLTFNAHLKKLTASLSSNIRIARATVHTSWGWRRSTLKMVFHALIRSKLDYAAPAWQPWLSAINLSCLDCLQNRSFRLIIGQFVSTPLDTLRLEVDVQSYHTCSNRSILKAREKALRSIDDHPKRVALAPDIPQRLQNRCSFRRKANELSTLLPPELQHQQSMKHFPSPAWQLTTSLEGRISTTVPGVTYRADDINLKCRCSLSTIASYQADYTIYIDGSVSRGTRNGGAAAVVTKGSPTQPEVVTIIKTKGRTFTSSYEEEAAAMESALSLTSTHVNHSSISILFCTDSKSLLEAFILSNPRTCSIHHSINSIASSTFIQWIPGHSDVPGNDLGGKPAKEATTIATNTILLISFCSFIQVINETIRDDPPTHERVAPIYQHHKAFHDVTEIENKKDGVLLARLRSDHYPSLQQYLH